MPRPRISTNLAISADGKISSDPPQPSGWTSAADHARLMKLRETADALMIGHGTLEADRMTMTVPGKPIQPLRCVVSRTGRMDSKHPIFSTPGGAIHWLVTGESEISQIPAVTIHRQSLMEFLEELGTKFDVGHLHCEGGGQLIGELAALDVIDEFHLTLAGHTIFGGRQAPTASGVSEDFLPTTVGFELADCQPSPDSGECFLSYRRIR